jgi:hypothetical protein
MASALARTVAAGQLPAAEVPEAWQRITAVPVVLRQIQDAPAVVAMTQRLKRKSAYDAAYIVLSFHGQLKVTVKQGYPAPCRLRGRRGEQDGLRA